jgi:dUTP pyrophosphatase
MFIKLYPEAQIPTRATAKSAGYDLHSNEELYLHPGGRSIVSTGVAIDWPDRHMMPGRMLEAQIRPRSGLAVKHGITVLNTPGTIDADYQLEVKVILANHSAQGFAVRRGDRIAQLVFNEVLVFDEILAQRVGGMGSTGE